MLTRLFGFAARAPTRAAAIPVADTSDDLPAPPYIFDDDCLGGAPLSLSQYHVVDRDASGLWVWGAGAHLARWLCSAEAHEFVRVGAAAVELGAGPGLVSLVLARLGMRPVATDADDAALALCAANAAANGLDVHVRALAWGDAEAAAQLLAAFDAATSTTPARLLVVGSDVLYDRASFDGLVDTIVALARGHHVRGGAAVDVLLAWVRRGRNEEQVLERCKDVLAGDAAAPAVVLRTLWSGGVALRRLVGEAGGTQRVVVAALSVRWHAE